MAKRYQIQRLDIGGYWNEDREVDSLDEAKGLLEGFLRHNPKFDWGGRVVDTMTGVSVYEP